MEKGKRDIDVVLIYEVLKKSQIQQTQKPVLIVIINKNYVIYIIDMRLCTTDSVVGLFTLASAQACE